MPDRRAQRHEATRQEILQVAWRLARAQGLTGWSMREVATQVGMRAPSLYVYFESKEAIYDAMFAQGYEQLLARVEAAGPTPDDPAAALDRIGRLFFEFCVEDPARHQLLFLRVIPGFVPSRSAYALAEEVLARLRRELAAVGIRGERAVDLWTAIITGLVTQQVSNDPGGDRWARLVRPAVEMFVASESLAVD